MTDFSFAKRLGAVTLHVTPLPPEVVPSQDCRLRSHELSSPAFHSPAPKIRLVLKISTLRAGGGFHLFCRVTLLWQGFCCFQMFISLPVH